MDQLRLLACWWLQHVISQKVDGVLMFCGRPCVVILSDALGNIMASSSAILATPPKVERNRGDVSHVGARHMAWITCWIALSWNRTRVQLCLSPTHIKPDRGCLGTKGQIASVLNPRRLLPRGVSVDSLAPERNASQRKRPKQ